MPVVSDLDLPKVKFWVPFQTSLKGATEALGSAFEAG